MTLIEQLEFIKEQTIRMNAYKFAQNTISWDSAAGGAPKSGIEKKSQYAGILAGESFRIMTDEKFMSAVKEAYANLDKIEFIEDKAMVREWNRTIERMSKIPENEYTDFVELVSKTEVIWEEAKQNSDFNMFVPYYESIFGYLRKFADYYGYKEHPYDALLEDFEPGMTVKQLDDFFGQLKAEIVPLLKEIKSKNSNENMEFINREISKEKQKNLGEFLLDTIKYNRKNGLVAESEHPFTNGISFNDVRITTNYDLHNFTASFYSLAHEGGHGIYEQNQSEELEDRGLRDGASAGIHESQSRMYENMFCRSKEFWSFMYPKLNQYTDGVFSDISLKELLKAINHVDTSFIRVEADELTYPLHIMVRYEIEKAIMEGTLEVKDLSKVWNEKMKEYLGIEPKNDAEGVLQDVHWAAGLFGYFPSYALGNAFAAQFVHYMKKDFDIASDLENGDFSRINKWLKEKIHQFGKVYLPMELIEKATGEPFNPSYYTEYLKEKYM